MTPDETSVTEAGKAEDMPENERSADTESSSSGEVDTDASAPGRRKRVADAIRKWSSGKLLYILLGALVVASLALLGSLVYFSYLPDRETGPAATKAAISAASDGTIAVLSYSPDSLDRDFASAKSHLTGEFLSYYDQFTQQIVAPAAKQKAVKTNAVVLRAAVSNLHPDSADVLLFVNQSTQSKDRPEPTFTSNSVLVTLTKTDGKWLISSFNPI